MVSGQTAAPPAGQTASPKEAQAQPQGLRKLTGDDAKRAKQLDEQIDKAIKEDRWDEAMARVEELLALRTRAQGPKHFETVSTEWILKALRRVASMPQRGSSRLPIARYYESAGDGALRPAKVRPGPAAVREGAGDLPPTAHRRPPRHCNQYNKWR